jgi:DNA-binding XRE family transcriptional regulator
MNIQRSPETGEVIITLTRDEYDDLIDGVRHEATMRGIADGFIETLTDADVGDYLAAPTPIAFWRKHRGLTQQQLADAIGVSQPYIALLENGQREAMGSVYGRLATALRVRADDLIPDPPPDAA